MALTINVLIGLDPTLMKLATGFTTTIEASLAKILVNQEKIMSSLDDDIAAIAAQTTAVASLTTFVQGLQAQIAAIPSLTAAQQAQIQAVFDGVSSNTAAITAAMTTNVPVDPNAPV